MEGIWGPGSSANRETMAPKSSLTVKAIPASFTVFPLHLVNTNSAFTNASGTPGHGQPMNASEPGRSLGSAPREPRQPEIRLQQQCQGTRHPPWITTASAWQHQGIYSPRHDCIRPSMTTDKTELHPTALKSCNSKLLRRLYLFK